MRIRAVRLAFALIALSMLICGCSKKTVDEDLEAASEAITRGDRAAAAKYVSQAISADPEDPVRRYMVVMIYTRPGYHKEQIQAAKDLLKLLDSGVAWPRSAMVREPQMYTQIAMLMDSGGEPELARKCYEKALEVEPDDPIMSNNLAYFYAQENIELDKAEQLARYAISKQPKRAFILDTMGWVLYRQGKYAEAEKYLYEAVKRDPNIADCRYHLAVVYAARNKKENAKIELSKCLTLDPNYADASILLKVLNQKGGKPR